MTGAVGTHLLAGFDGFIAELKEFCRIPSVSTDPAYAGGIEIAAAQWVARRLSAAGMNNVEIAPTGGHPAVLGEWLGAPAGAPTVLVYGHYDVQPPDPVALWTTPPFEPTIRDGRLYARGAADDKGPVLVPILVAEAFLRATGPAAGQSEIPDRGRGGSRQRASRIVPRGPCRPPRSRHDRLGRRCHVARRLADRDGRQSGDLRARVHGPRRRQGPALRPAWRQRAESTARHRRHGREPPRGRRSGVRRRLW